MNRQATLAIVAPADRMAGWFCVDDNSVTLMAPESKNGSVLSGGAFLARYPTAQLVMGLNESNVLDQLANAEEKSFALEFTLLLFDEQVSANTRREIACELNELLQSQSIRDYLLDIMLSAPLPRSADIVGARQASADHERTLDLVASIVDSLDRVSLVWSAWRGMRSNSMVQSRDYRELTGHLINCGVFRRIVLGARDQAELEGVKQQLIFDHTLTSQCDPRILSSFLNSVRSGLPSGGTQGKRRPPMRRETPDAVETIPSANRRSTESHANATKKHSWAVQNVQKIAKCFAQGDDEDGNAFLEQLIQEQTSNTRDHSHVVKSLCNLANHCTIAGRREISLNSLRRALEFPEGADAVLFLQMGNEFRELDHYTEAIECYRKAQSLDRGERADSIRNEIIRLSVHQGDYESALEQYLAIPGIENDVSALQGLATLHRRMGALREATRVYSRVLRLTHDGSDAAEAGLAETSKQAGRIHRAIRQYNRLFNRHIELDPGSAKAYELGMAHLLRLAGQFPAAEGRYLQQLDLYPKDCGIHFQLAKHYALTGNRLAEKDHLRKARREPLSGIAADLFALFMETAPLAYSGYTPKGNSPVNLTDYLPEDRGLAGCTLALQALRDDDPARVRGILQGVKFVDRIHSEFGTVLQFHAARRLDSGFDFKSDSGICRIAKRGYSTLKSATHAIANGDLAAAMELEQRMCLFVT